MNILNRSIRELKLSTRVTNTLLWNKIDTVKKLVDRSPVQIWCLPGIGRGSVNEIIVNLEAKGLKLAPVTDRKCPHCGSILKSPR